MLEENELVKIYQLLLQNNDTNFTEEQSEESLERLLKNGNIKGWQTFCSSFNFVKVPKDVLYRIKSTKKFF